MNDETADSLGNGGRGMKGEALTDPRETFPEMGENAYAMREPPDPMELLAELIRETRRVEKHASWMEHSNHDLRRRLAEKEEKIDALTERVVRAERALVAADDTQAGSIPAAVYLETMDEDYIARLRSDNEEARSL